MSQQCRAIVLEESQAQRAIEIYTSGVADFGGDRSNLALARS
ncbi:hypothetical protein [Chroococcidiopsis sp. CCMEE 29]|nr:hypothetical protein [Chroococcidiopsis sp. CCMEE 29]